MRTLSNQVLKVAAVAGLSCALTGMMGFPVSARAAENSSSTKPETPKSESPLKQRQEMIALREKMLAEAKAEDATLSKLVAELNRVPENKKVDLMATILTKLVAQHHQMLGEWETMHARMMQFRKERMSTGAASMSKSSMNVVPGGKTATTAQK